MNAEPMLPQPHGDFSAADFDALLVAVQPRLRAYVTTLLGGCSAVDDIVQDTCVVLIQKRELFEPGTNFTAWAFRVAYFKAAGWRRDMQREGRVMLTEPTFQAVAAIAEARFSERPPIADALSKCLAELPARDQELIRIKYADGVSLTQHAAETTRNANALHKAISRVRLVLRACVDRRLRTEADSR